MLNDEIVKLAEYKALYSGLMLARGLVRLNIPPAERLPIMYRRKGLHWERALKAAKREIVRRVEASTCPNCGAGLVYGVHLAPGCGYCGFCHMAVKGVQQ